MKARSSLLCAALLLGAASAQTQGAPQPTPPQPTLVPAASGMAAGVAVAPSETAQPATQTSAAQTSAAQTRATQPSAAPVSAADTARAAAPLVIGFKAEVPGYRAGQKIKVPVSKELRIPAERAAIIRERGIVTQSLGEDLDRWIRELNTSAGARFERQSSGWVLVQHDRFKVDPEAARAALLSAIKDPAMRPGQVKVLSQTAPERDLNFFISRGVTAHLATGNTNYRGSSKARMTNIHTGASRFKDRLFEGDVFSFNRFLGPITAGNGYVNGLVIAGDRTEEGLGGGICQVSTTVFRSLYRAGLPVVERSPHSYQVGYYRPQGLDAAIYQPSLDLKFKNDTGGAIWFQTDWNDATGEFNVYAFGKPRDFEVRLSEPRTVRTVPAPADRVITTDKLAKGQRQQVDWAAPGGTLEVDRLFLRGGKVFKKETLTSTYRPWPNIFLVGR